MVFKPLAQQQPHSIQNLLQLIVSRTDPDAVVLFGSRARGTHREQSDFDLVVKGKRCAPEEWTTLLLDIEEEPVTLYSIDLLDDAELTPAYHEQIVKEGKILYERP